ncbi:MAG: hypothetical protein R2707_05800 [Acidimicrobiales bacterium]
MIMNVSKDALRALAIVGIAAIALGSQSMCIENAGVGCGQIYEPKRWYQVADDRAVRRVEERGHRAEARNENAPGPTITGANVSGH